MKRNVLLVGLIVLSVFAIGGFAVAQTQPQPSYDTAVLIEPGWNLLHFDTLESLLIRGDINRDNFVVGWAFNPQTQEYVILQGDSDDVMSATKQEKEVSLKVLWESYKFGEDWALLFYYKGDRIRPLINLTDMQYFDGKNEWKFPMFKGWNFVGISAEMVDNAVIPQVVGAHENYAMDFASLKGDCNIEKIYFFAESGGGWNALPLDARLDWTAIGKGVIIKVSNEKCTLFDINEAGGTIPSVPSLP